MQISAISCSQTPKQNFGVRPTVGYNAKALMKGKLNRAILDEVVELLEKIESETSELTNLHIDVSKNKLIAQIINDYTDNVKLKQRHFESTIGFFKRVYKRAVRTNEVVKKIVKNHSLDNYKDRY